MTDAQLFGIFRAIEKRLGANARVYIGATIRNLASAQGHDNPAGFWTMPNTLPASVIESAPYMRLIAYATGHTMTIDDIWFIATDRKMSAGVVVYYDSELQYARLPTLAVWIIRAYELFHPLEESETS